MPVQDDYTKGLITMPNALWNAIITMTTVGYGDISTTTPFGKFAAVMAAIAGGQFEALLTVSALRGLRAN